MVRDAKRGGQFLHLFLILPVLVRGGGIAIENKIRIKGRTSRDFGAEKPRFNSRKLALLLNTGDVIGNSLRGYSISASFLRSALPLLFIGKLSRKWNFRGTM